jgi:uncharacterized membrane protein
VLIVLTLVIVGAACVVRLLWLGTQSYWVDEQWSVGVASLSLADSLHTVKTEVHPPLYQVLLWAWVQAGGTDPWWTRALSAAFGLVGVALSYVLFRRVALDLRLRLLFVALAASSGMAIVYSQETRSYALLWACAVALTALTVRITARTAAATATPRRDWILWALWGALASSTHLFGAVLVLACVVAVAVLRRTELGALALAAAVALLPQIAWQLWGLLTPQFGGATGWIPAPDAAAVLELLTSVFAVDGLHITDGGFPWTSWAGVVAYAVIALGVVVIAVVRRGSEPLARAEPGGDAALQIAAAQGAGRAATTMAVVTLTVVVTVWLIAQVVHIWTLRNMIVILPAATWGATAGLFALAAKARIESWVTGALLVLMGVGLVSVAANLNATYKTDFDSAARYLDQQRHEDPDALFVGNFTPSWLLSSGRSRDDAYLEWLFSRSTSREASDVALVDPQVGTTVFAYWVGNGTSVDDAAATILHDAPATARCDRVPIFGLAVVRCERQ